MRQFGLIGQPLSHSFSKKYFTEKFKKEVILDANYELYPLNSIQEFASLIKSISHLVGLNVTIPFKESVIPYLDELDPLAEKVGAINTIKFEKRKGNLKLIGYNTDIIGFRESLKPFLAKEHDRALIFGTGGSSKAIALTLKELQIPFHRVSRNPKNDHEIAYSDLDANTISCFRLLINCTPLGTSPKTDQMIPISLNKIGPNHLVYDLIYNPTETRLLKEAKKKGALIVNGHSMLKLQAEASWKIWNKVIPQE